MSANPVIYAISGSDIATVESTRGTPGAAKIHAWTGATGGVLKGSVAAQAVRTLTADPVVLKSFAERRGALESGGHLLPTAVRFSGVDVDKFPRSGEGRRLGCFGFAAVAATFLTGDTYGLCGVADFGAVAFSGEVYEDGKIVSRDMIKVAAAAQESGVSVVVCGAGADMDQLRAVAPGVCFVSVENTRFMHMVPNLIRSMMGSAHPLRAASNEPDGPVDLRDGDAVFLWLMCVSYLSSVEVLANDGAGRLSVMREFARILPPSDPLSVVRVARESGVFAPGRTFRCPHFTVSYSAMAREIGLARNGVLLFDEADRWSSSMLADSVLIAASGSVAVVRPSEGGRLEGVVNRLSTDAVPNGFAVDASSMDSVRKQLERAIAIGIRRSQTPSRDVVADVVWRVACAVAGMGGRVDVTQGDVDTAREMLSL